MPSRKPHDQLDNRRVPASRQGQRRPSSSENDSQTQSDPNRRQRDKCRSENETSRAKAPDSRRSDAGKGRFPPRKPFVSPDASTNSASRSRHRRTQEARLAEHLSSDIRPEITPESGSETISESISETTKETSPESWQQVSWFDVSEHQAGQRLDNFLMTRLKGVPKSRIYRLIREGEVRVNKGRVKADTRVQTGDQVRVAPIRRSIGTAVVAEVSPQLAEGIKSRILWEGDGLIVLNKPAGMAVHGGSGVSIGIIEALRQAMDKPWLELVHRIDKDTSGLLMISTKSSVLKRLQDDFREGRIRKRYQAVLQGWVGLDKQRVDQPLLRYELPNQERRVKVSPEGKDSQTDFTVLERFRSKESGDRTRAWAASWVQAAPLTGRTHQIRVHAQSLGHPLLGDEKYAQTERWTGPRVRRLCLHAAELTVPGFGQLSAPLAEDIEALLEQLRQG